MGSNSIAKTFTVAALLCIVCSFFVSTSVVVLRPAQEANKRLDLKRNLLVSAGLVDTNATAKTIEERFDKLTSVVVDLDSGMPTDKMDSKEYDQRKAAKDPKLSKKITNDVAGIGRRELFSKVFVSKKNGMLDMLILPVYGKGLWSTMYGFLAIDSDFTTVRGIGFYEHGETPGLGGEIDNPSWKKLWIGKKIYDLAGKQRLGVIKGKVDPAREDSIYQIDGISGATLTSNGVDHMIDYWMSEDGYAKFINKLKRNEVSL